MLGCVHGRVKVREMANAQNLVGRDGGQVQFNRRGKGQGAFRADQQMGQVFRSNAGHQGINVITADPPLHRWKAGGDLGCFPPAQSQQRRGDIAKPCGYIGGLEVTGQRAEMQLAAVRQQGIDRVDVLHHTAVADGTRAARIVAGHTPDRSPG